jgi:hypothetical protein
MPCPQLHDDQGTRVLHCAPSDIRYSTSCCTSMRAGGSRAPTAPGVWKPPGGTRPGAAALCSASMRAGRPLAARSGAGTPAVGRGAGVAAPAACRPAAAGRAARPALGPPPSSAPPAGSPTPCPSPDGWPVPALCAPPPRSAPAARRGQGPSSSSYAAAVAAGGLGSSARASASAGDPGSGQAMVRPPPMWSAAAAPQLCGPCTLPGRPAAALAPSPCAGPRMLRSAGCTSASPSGGCAWPRWPWAAATGAAVAARGSTPGPAARSAGASPDAAGGGAALAGPGSAAGRAARSARGGTKGLCGGRRAAGAITDPAGARSAPAPRPARGGAWPAPRVWRAAPPEGDPASTPESRSKVGAGRRSSPLGF